MRYPRFRVATVTGFTITPERTSRRSGTAKPGLSAHVLDSLHLYALVATYRSEDYVPMHKEDGTWAGATRRGHDGALRAAQDHAERLNRTHRMALHREHMRESRDEL